MFQGPPAVAKATALPPTSHTRHLFLGSCSRGAARYHGGIFPPEPGGLITAPLSDTLFLGAREHPHTYC